MKSVITICMLMLCITVTKSEVSPSLSPSASCSNIIYDMIDCVSFLSSDSTEEKPSAACCSGFETVLNINAECICEALKSSADLGVDVNLTKAAVLPSACKVSAPPISACNLTVSPSPGAAPAANAPSSESPIPNSPEMPTVLGSSESPTPSTPADDVVDIHAPSPSSSGTYSLPSCFFALLSMLVISFSSISV